MEQKRDGFGLPNRHRVRRKLAAFAAAILTVFALLGTAHAGPGRPVSGRDYVRQGSGDGTFIHIWIKPNARIYAPGLAEVFRTTVKEIRKLNPEQTVAICYDPKLRKSVQAKTVTSDPKTRATNEIWEGCAEANRWIYVFPGSVLTLPDPMTEIMKEKLAAEDETPSSEPLPAKSPVTNAVKPAPPAPAPAPPTAAPPAPSVAARQPNDEVRGLERKLRTERAKIKGLAEKNGELKALVGEAEQRLGASEDLLKEKNEEIAKLQAGMMPEAVRYVFLSVFLVLVAGLFFTGYRLRASRIETADLKDRAGFMEGQTQTLNKELERANLARETAESGQAYSDRVRAELERKLTRAERIEEERKARIRELESSERRLSSKLNSLREAQADTNNAFAAEVQRMEREKDALLNNLAEIDGVNLGLRADVERLTNEVSSLRQRLNDSYLEEIREGAIEEDARAVSELPGPTEGDRALSELAPQLFPEEVVPATDDLQLHAAVAQAAESMPGPQEDDEEPCPATVAGVAPRGDLPVDHKVSDRPRVPTLPQGMRHVADLLLPGSKYRDAFFEASEAICEAAAHVGGVKVTKRGEISSLNKLAKLWFEVDTPDQGVKPVRIQDFADDANVLTFHPVST